MVAKNKKKKVRHFDPETNLEALFPSLLIELKLYLCPPDLVGTGLKLRVYYLDMLLSQQNKRIKFQFETASLRDSHIEVLKTAVTATISIIAAEAIKKSSEAKNQRETC